jgi:hypothetical protein
VDTVQTLRRAARDALLRLVVRVLRTEEAGTAVSEMLASQLSARPPFVPDRWSRMHEVYPELGRSTAARAATRPAAPIIITGRFRSGSTLLWNIFRQTPACTAYYEPFNERRWFDPATRGTRVDRTHVGVIEYWREYEGLEHLGQHYREDWIDRHLFMDAWAWNPSMARYVTCLIEAARGRAVLQFNRIDFRLPWFRAHFPDAVFVHIFRNARDQWLSCLTDTDRFPRDSRVSEFAAFDHYYLLPWVRDLKARFPFLDEREVSHPYELFYYLWKLSYLFGTTYADYSLAFEHLVAQPRREIARLMRAVPLDTYDLDRAASCVVGVPTGRWRDYADDHWFAAHESRCETVLERYFTPPWLERSRHAVPAAKQA